MQVKVKLHPIFFHIVVSEAIFNEALDFESRYYLLSVAFYSFHSFYIQSFEKRSGYIYNRNVDGALGLTFAERNTIIKCTNTILVQLKMLKKSNTQQSSISLDRLGTHCLENYFGNVRNLCRGFDSYEIILNNVAHAQISNNFLYDIGMINKNKKRVNEGGARIFPSLDDERIRITIEFHPVEFAEIILNYGGIPFSNCCEDRKDFTQEEIDAVLDTISLWWCEIPKRKYKNDHCDASSVKISARCIALSKAGKKAGFLEPKQAFETQNAVQNIMLSHRTSNENMNYLSNNYYGIVLPKKTIWNQSNNKCLFAKLFSTKTLCSLNYKPICYSKFYFSAFEKMIENKTCNLIIKIILF